MLARITRLYRQGLLPVLPIAVLKLNRNRRANRLSLAHTGEDVSGVAFNFHAAATAIALLPPPELTVDESLVDLEPGRDAGKKSDQSFTVRFSGCEITQHKCSILPDAAFLWSLLIAEEGYADAQKPNKMRLCDTFCVRKSL